MLNHMNLTVLEKWAVNILTKSNRIGLLVVKELNSENVYIVRDNTDQVPLGNSNKKAEPLSMELERMYHAPSFGENE